MLERNNDTTKKMIEILKNNENILIFYSRRHLKYLNIDKIVKEVDIDIVPVRITSNTIEPVSHNRDGILENIDIYLQNKFSVEILNKVDFNKGYNKEKFIEILKKKLYPDNGYFNEKDIFIKGNNKINKKELIYI